MKMEASCALRLRLYPVNSALCKMEGYRKLSVPKEKQLIQLRQMKFKDRGRFQSKQSVEHDRVSTGVLDWETERMKSKGFAEAFSAVS